MQFTFIQLATAIMAFTTFAVAAPAADAIGEIESVASDIVGMLALDNSDRMGTSSAVSASGDVSASAYNIGIAWMGPSQTGTSVYINVDTLPSSCMEINGSYDNNMSSFYLVAGVTCTFWRNHGCTGSGFYINSPGGVIVNSMGSYDNDMSSYRCALY